MTVALRAYRPGRRAVVEVCAPDGQRWFVNVVRPAAIAGLLERHRLMCRQVPVMPVLSWTSTGALILPAAPGTPLRALIDAGTPLPSAQVQEDLLDHLPVELAALPQRRSPLAQAADSAAIIAHTAGAHDQLRCSAESLAADLAEVSAVDGAAVAVHGDFYEGQLLADSNSVTGLLDVDTAGAGHRADDWATLIGHLELAKSTRAQQYFAEVLEHAGRRTDPVGLRARVCAVLVGAVDRAVPGAAPRMAEPDRYPAGAGSSLAERMRDHSFTAPGALIWGREPEQGSTMTPCNSRRERK